MARKSHSHRRHAASPAVSILLLLLSASGVVAADGEAPTAPSPPPAVPDSKCGCFVANGSSGSGDSDTTFFAYHKFFDFRSLSCFQGTPDLLADGQSTTAAPPTSAYFLSDNFTSFWQVQTWNSSATVAAADATTAPLLRINSLNNIFIEKNTDNAPSPLSKSATWLTLRTARQNAFQSTAEIATQGDTYQYMSMRMLARTIGSPGGCTAMFTYRPAPDGSGATGGPGSGGDGAAVVQEADLEVLTKYPRNQVQCTNQPSLDSNGQINGNATQNVTLPAPLTWDNWAVYRLDWTPHTSQWFVNGEPLASIAFQVPRDPARIHVNAWSDGNSWTGGMALGTQAHLQIQWWELLYNLTASNGGGGGCTAVCSIDTADGPPGQAVLLSPSRSAAPRSSSRPNERSSGLCLVSWMPAIAAAVMLYATLSP